MTKRLSVLIVEDSPIDAQLVVDELCNAGFALEWKRVETEPDFLAALQYPPDIILCDYALPQFDGLQALKLLKDSGVKVPLIIVSGTIGEETAVATMKHGAADYLLKDRLARLGPAVSHVLEQSRLRWQRKQAEEALRQSEARFAKAFRSNPAAMCITTIKEGRFIEVNDRYQELFGYLRRKLIGRTSLELALWNKPEERASLVERLRNHGLVRDHETLFRRENGDILDALISMELIEFPGEQEPVLISMFADITERKRADERVREQASMLDRTRDAIIVRGFRDRKITFWSKGAESLYGWTVAEAMGRDIAELICVDPVGQDEIWDEWPAADERRGDTRHMTKDGRQLIVNTRATLVRGGAGEPKSVLSINTDITEQKDLEARLLRAQRMESIGTLASGVAHDLNNVLGPIMMSVALLRRELTAEQREEFISMIELTAARGAEIVKQVFTFGRGLEGERKPLSVDVLIQELLKILSGTFPNNITVDSSIGAGLWPVIGDATQFHQVLMNLCVNARDAMPDGGKLHLQAANLHIDANHAGILAEARPGPFVLLEVSDTGSGIPPEIADRIFDPFFTTKELGKGTGLGLSTAHGIVKSHGGVIHVTTQPGNGTTFQVYLPASPNREVPTDATRAQIPAGNDEVVLVVDDETGVRDATRLILETAGYRVLLAADGTEALATFAQNFGSVAAMLTDLRLPHLDGVSLIRVVHTMAPDLPIIASTGLGERAHLAKLKSIGAATVLHKPYGGDLLLRALRDALHPAAHSPIA